MRVRSTSLCSLVFCLAASSLLFSSPAGAVAGYGDVEVTQFYAKAVQWSVDEGITGITGSCFSPKAPVPRGETALWFWNMEDQPAPEADHSFTDITDPQQNDAVSWMAEQGITTGTGDGTTFSPQNTLTRGQIAAFLWRLETSQGNSPTAEPHAFTDVTAAWQQDPVSWMSEQGITTGTGDGTTFSPGGTLIRSELITFLYRYNDEPDVTVSSSSPTCNPDAADDPDAADTVFTAVSSGGTHACALDSLAAVTCWGDNTDNQNVAATGTYTQVSAGGSHTCGVTVSASVRCWGDNTSGQTDVPSTGTYQSVSAGAVHTCALRTDGRIVCWGSTNDGRSTPPDGSFKAVSAGHSHSCAIKTDDTATCWGDDSDERTAVPDGTFKQISAGDEHTCAITADDTVACWGQNDQGQSDAPAGTFKSVSAGGGQSCAIASDDTIMCWGSDSIFPTLTDAPEGTFQDVSSSVTGNCALTTAGTLFCWGYDQVADTPSN